MVLKRPFTHLWKAGVQISWALALTRWHQLSASAEWLCYVSSAYSQETLTPHAPHFCVWKTWIKHSSQRDYTARQSIHFTGRSQQGMWPMFWDQSKKRHNPVAHATYLSLSMLVYFILLTSVQSLNVSPLFLYCAVTHIRGSSHKSVNHVDIFQYVFIYFSLYCENGQEKRK